MVHAAGDLGSGLRDLCRCANTTTRARLELNPPFSIELREMNIWRHGLQQDTGQADPGGGSCGGGRGGSQSDTPRRFGGLGQIVFLLATSQATHCSQDEFM